MSFNVPVHAIKAPIANDYLLYNSYANHGELVNAKLWNLVKSDLFKLIKEIRLN